MTIRSASVGCLIFLCVGCGIAFAQEPAAQPRPKHPGVRAQSPIAAEPSANAAKNPITPRRTEANSERTNRPAAGSFSIWKMFGALIIAIAGILAASKLFKAFGPFSPIRPLPDSVCAVLGVTTLPNRHTLYLMRVGRKVLLMSSTGEQLTNVAEFADPEEVAFLIAQCRPESEPTREEGSFFGRLLTQLKGEAEPQTPPLPSDSDARRKLEEKFQSFAQSSSGG